jgi:hypothetical protein
MGASFDRTGSYGPMLAIFAVFSMLAAAATVMAGHLAVSVTEARQQEYGDFR